jgi:hypothetical protein
MQRLNAQRILTAILGFDGFTPFSPGFEPCCFV